MKITIYTLIGWAIGCLFLKCCFAGVPEGQTVTLCGQDALEYPLKSGWQDFAYCEGDKLVMVKEKKVKGKTVYTKFILENRIYHRSETSLPCGISTYKCEVEKFNEKATD